MFPGAEIAAAFRCGSDQTMVDVPGVVLFADRERAVFIPGTGPTRQAEALDFFSNNARRRFVGAMLLQSWRWTGAGLRAVQLSLPENWRDRFDAELEAASLYAGSPGPLQKLSLLLPARSRKGTPHLIKVALRPSADAAIAREADCLARLAGAGEGIRQNVPELTAEGFLPSGRRYLATTACIGRRGSATLLDEYMCFLRSVARATREDVYWDRGDALLHTRRRLQALGPQAMPAVLRRSLHEALDFTATQLLGKIVPHTLMHGDFTRFNICQSGDHFVVFDWEYSRLGCNPLADALHYRLSRRRVVSARWTLRDAIADAARFAELAFETWRPTNMDLAALALHAMVDTISVYAAADGYLDTRSYLIRRYVGLIGSRRAWGCA